MEGHGKGSSRLRGIFERWVGFVQRRAPAVIIIAVLLTAGVLFYSLRNFRINTDINSMISEKLRFRVLEKDFSRAFPQFTDTLVVVLDADTPERAFSARAQLAERLRKETALFKTVYEPGGGEFFEKNGLLYLDAKELNEFADKMAGAQPLLALLSRDLSLRGLFSVLETAMSRPEFKEMQGTTVDQLFSGMSRTFDGVASHRPRRMSWEELMLGVKEADEQRNQFIVLQPFLDETGLSGGEVPIERIRLIAKELSLDEAHGVKVRITGDVALSHETLAEVRKSTGVATIVSLVLVAALLFFGLGRSLRLVVAGLATLLIGLIWTTGFALAAVGSLNMISITFAVLFIGLGIDYSIQFCLRYRELIRSGHEHNESVRTTAKGVGRSLLLSAITTAIGFYSFVPTAYAGVAELGIISGTGMFISFFANLTVLPALLALLPIKDKQATPSEGSRLIAFPYTHSRAVIIAAAILGLGSAALAPRLRFDYNPLNLYDPRSESVIAIRELFKGAESMPWTSSVLVRGAKEAKVKAEKLRKLKEVKMVATVFDFVPENQPEKLRIISDIALFMPPMPEHLSVTRLDYTQDLKALDGFEKALSKYLAASPGSKNSPAGRLAASINRFKALLADPAAGDKAFTSLERGLLANLPILFKRLDTSLQASEITLSSLPPQLVSQYVAADGRYRVQVFPAENILNTDALARFVHAVRSVAPDATDAPVVIYESGRAVITSFEQATLYALVAIVLFLLFDLRSFSTTALILVPLLLAVLMTAAASVLLGIPLNFANVVVVPLLLGVGVHSGIIFILRYQTEPPADGNMLRTSTARAVLVSTLTTVISTGSLSFSPHRGISSMGILLSICFGLLVLCILLLMPALLNVTKENKVK